MIMYKLQNKLMQTKPAEEGRTFFRDYQNSTKIVILQ